MKVFANGREVDVPTDQDGNVDVVQVRRAANIPNSRDIIQQGSDGSNTLMPKKGMMSASPYDRFMDVSRAQRGQI